MSRRKHPSNSEAQVQPGRRNDPKDSVFETVAFAHRVKKNRRRNKLARASRKQ